MVSMGSTGKSLPVDRGWAWMVMLGGFGVHFFTFGYVKSFGILFIEIQEKFGSTSYMTSIISGVQSCTFSLATLFVVHVLMKKFTVRTLCIIGVVFQGLGIALSSFVPNIGLMILTLGAFYGVGQSLLYCPTMVIINQYFDKKRPIATSIACCGVSAGGVAYPFLARYFIDTYVLSGGLLLMAGLALQQCICVSLFTPPESYSAATAKNSLTEAVEEEQAKLIASKAVSVNDSVKVSGEGDFETAIPPVDKKNMNAFIFLSDKDLDSGKYDESTNEAAQEISVTSSLICKEIDSSQNADHNTKKSSIPSLKESNSNHLNCDINYDTEREFYQISNRECNETENRNKSRRCSCKIPELVKSFSFWLVGIFFAAGGISSVLYSIFLPPLMKEKHMSNQEVSLCLIMASITEGLGRFIPGVILQLGFFRPTSIVIGPMLICALLFHMTPFINDVILIMCLAASWGFLTGFFWSLQSLVVIEVFGFERLGPALSIYINFLGFGSGISYPIAGALRDIFSTYSATYHYMGIMYWLAGLSMILIQFFIRDKKVNTKSKSAE
ncbi:monocarboxylate transporter 9-like isoform X1 [Biomphalaria glabrata]|uniref:Monocarboxylate transporter 9-like isoform X1 n=1 Tax=Biomphalaria glabrata TaxID=6526 RepID=A0A9W2Z8B5_BIOGL|nr:monocarboxylate transporter 9-like isoform X1 [Biomphalaria glabrata]XP_055871229.1 monocarboxylate transporter 9-like isoform X1 [Biomphalaria glabrata]